MLSTISYKNQQKIDNRLFIYVKIMRILHEMDQSNFHVIVGRQVRLHRRAQGLSQKGLAALADVHSTYISNIERGEVSASLYCFYKIAQALGILLADLFCVLDPNCNSDFENEFAVVMSKIRHMDDVQRGLYLGAIKGMLPK